jgi:hypothetical protein
MVDVNRNKVFISSISLTSPHVSTRAGHLQVNTIIFLEASYCLTYPLFRLLLHILSLVILYNNNNNKVLVMNATGCNPQK